MGRAEEELRRAAALHAQGDFTGALRAAERALAQRPKDSRALQFAGVLRAQTGDSAGGAKLLRQALKSDPDDLGVRLNLLRALMDAGDLAEAETYCAGGATSSAPAEMRRIRADILKARGRPEEAAAAYEHYLSINQNDFEAWNNLGNTRCEIGDIDGALVALDRARVLKPEAAVIYLNIGRALVAFGREEESLAFLWEATRRAPRDPVAFIELADVLNSLDRPAEALPYLGTAAKLQPSNGSIFVALGITYLILDDRAQAEQGFRLAMKVEPSCAAAYLNLGIMLEQSNRLDEIDELLSAAEAAGISGTEIDYLRALALRRAGKLDDALALGARTVPGVIDPTVRANFIGQTADHLGQVDTAYRAFEEMNRAAAATPAGAKFSGREYAQEIEDLTAKTTTEWYNSWRPLAPAGDPPSPTFLMGFPRSGTTLLDTILMGHPDTHVMEELPLLAQVEEALGDFSRLADLDQAQMQSLRQRYFEELAKRSPAEAGRLIIDKNPLSILRLPLIHRLFPDAKILFALRDPRDVVLSCYMQNFKVSKAMSSFLDLRNAATLYDRVLTYWEKCRAIFPLQVHLVRYEAMVTDVEGEVRPLLEFLDLPWDEKVLDHQRTASERGYIRTPSYAQVTERLYTRASGRWERYRPYMEHVLPILAPWQERFRYAD